MGRELMHRHPSSFGMHKAQHAELLTREQFGGLGSAGYALCPQESMKTDE